MKKIFTLQSEEGKGIYFSWQKTVGNYIAVNRGDNSVVIYNRHCEKIQNFSLTGIVTGFGWDEQGDTFAIISNKSSTINIWNANTFKLHQLESGFKETDSLTFIQWSKKGSLLAIGTNKGNLLIYNQQTNRKIPMIGKHTKTITAGVWSRENVLALAGDDKMLSMSESNGDGIGQVQFGGKLTNLQFGEMKTNSRMGIENTVSGIKDHKTLMFVRLDDLNHPILIQFRNEYGDIVAYNWYGDGYIMLGFSNGYFLVISTHSDEISTEIHLVKDYNNGLQCLAISNSLNVVATSGDGCVKMHDLSDWKRMHYMLNLDDEQKTKLDRMQWTEDGQLLAAATQNGQLNIFLTKLPMLGCTCGTNIAFLTSLLEVTLFNPIVQYTTQLTSITLKIEAEPSYIGLSRSYLVVGLNSRAWFYHISENSPAGGKHMREKEYPGSIQSIKINSTYAAAAMEGKILLHIIDDPDDLSSSNDKSSKMFPDGKFTDHKIISHELTEEFLIFATDKGLIRYFSLEDFEYSTEFLHSCGVRKIFADPSGSRLIILDDKNEGYIYNPITDLVISINSMAHKTIGALWDKKDEERGNFITYDGEMVSTYRYNRNTYKGSEVLFVNSTKLPFGQLPLIFYDGTLVLLTSSGTIQNIVLSSHDFQSYKEKDLNAEQMKNLFETCLLLNKYNEALEISEKPELKLNWQNVGKRALHNLDINAALKIYRKHGDVSMVEVLCDIMYVEEINLLCGHVNMILNDFQAAQKYFLISTKPKLSLEMRRDLMHWDEALHLAKNLDATQIPFISREYAQELEMTCEYDNALKHYEAGITRDAAYNDHDEACAAGIARMSIRVGDLKRGIAIANKMPSKVVKSDCAAILENIKQYGESASLYEKAELFEKAASVYIKAKNWTKVGELLPNVTSLKIHAQYARAREAEGKHKEAAKAYETAKDWENAVRLYLDHLKNPDEAVRIVRMSSSIEGARMIARFFENLKDFSTAIQFLVLSKCNDEAFRMADKHNIMEEYAAIIGSNATNEDYKSIAFYFENAKNNLLAGKFFYLCGNYNKALTLLLSPSCNEKEEALNLAVDVVGKANEQSLTKQLINLLMGDTDNKPREPKYLFRFYLVTKQYSEAARTAIIIAREEQLAGNYRAAHDTLFEMHQELRQQKLRIPAEMLDNLMLLHSYILVKIHMKQNNHLAASRMLIRVASNISKFPSHITQILISAVMECGKANLNNSAFSYAVMLMKPEYKDKLDPKYKKKVEHAIRKADKTELEEALSPCPHCDFQLSETELYCPNCKNNLPFCIATGRHLVKGDTCVCPSCSFPAIMSQFLKLLESEEPTCPMCSKKVDATNIKSCPNLSEILKRELLD